MQTALQPRPRAHPAPVTPKKIGPKVNPNKTNTPPPVKKDDRLNDWNDSWVRKHNDPQSCPCLQTSCEVSWMMCVIFWTCLIQHGIQLYMSPQANLFVWGFGSCFCGRWGIPDFPFLDELHTGVRLGVHNEIPVSPLWPMQPSTISDHQDLVQCESSWKSTLDQPDVVWQFLQEEIDGGFIERVPGGSCPATTGP